MSVIPAFRRLRLEDQELEARLNYIEQDPVTHKNLQ
jgi:hypothetical protein